MPRKSKSGQYSVPATTIPKPKLYLEDRKNLKIIKDQILTNATALFTPIYPSTYTFEVLTARSRGCSNSEVEWQASLIVYLRSPERNKSEYAQWKLIERSDKHRTLQDAMVQLSDWISDNVGFETDRMKKGDMNPTAKLAHNAAVRDKEVANSGTEGNELIPLENVAVTGNKRKAQDSDNDGGSDGASFPKRMKV
ncbi:hypothetical protein B0J11DRAFT_574064 [Dendryphion nanum]|uniref:Uncharacterized protein n=1 Tax=Dendryphion nanum TaxID=256645 RepID=A0A9P9EHR0_9PLEO|nr:hypothetical protein B0J11DRAFT_574064 [Dendryphion nanum]